MYLIQMLLFQKIIENQEGADKVLFVFFSLGLLFFLPLHGRNFGTAFFVICSRYTFFV